MKFKELKPGDFFTFKPRKDAFPSEEFEPRETLYKKSEDKSLYRAAQGANAHLPYSFSVGSINVEVRKEDYFEFNIQLRYVAGLARMNQEICQEWIQEESDLIFQ